MVHFTIFNKRIRYSFNVAFCPKLILQIALILSLALFFVGGGEESLDLLTHVLSLLPVHGVIHTKLDHLLVYWVI